MINSNSTKRFKCSSCNHEMTRTEQQILNKELGRCVKCETKLELSDFEGIRNRAAKDMERFKKDFK